MKNIHNHILNRLIPVFCAILLMHAGVLKSKAADGSWKNDADGNWSASANWLNSIIADGPGSTAYFTNAITAVRTITLSSARTNANLVFDNANAAINSGGWIVAGSGLTLSNSAATPIITVSNINELVTGLDPTNDVIVGSIITSPQGFIKNGPGTLMLTNANVLGASAQLNEGIVAVGNSSALGSGNRTVNFNGGGVRFWLGGPAYGNTNNVVTSCIIVSSNGNYDGVNGPFIGSGTLNLHVNARLSTAGSFTGFNGTVDLTGSSSSGIWRIGTAFNLSTVALNLGSTSGRAQPTFTSPATQNVLLGSLAGGVGSTLLGTDKNNTLAIWNIGYLNTSTVFDGRLRDNSSIRNLALTKVGTGALTLSAVSDYTGATIVSNGVLALTGTASLSGTPTITVFNPGIFDVSGLTTPFALIGANNTLAGNGVVTGNVAITTGTISPGSGLGSIATLCFTNDLSLDGTSTTTTNVFEIGSGLNDQIAVGGNLTLVGTVVVKLVPTGSSIPNGTYNIYKWGGALTGDTNNLVLSYASQPGTITVGTNLVTKTIFIQVAGAASSDLTWRGDGTANNWDLAATANWRTTVGGTQIVFNNGDNVTFDDTGSNNVPVNIVGTLNAGVALITNVAKNYELSSTSGGKISGSALITKKGAGMAIISADNDNAGLTTILGGVLQIGNGGSSGTLGVGGVTNAATLVFNRDTAANNGVIRGPGHVIQTGSGALTLSGANTYTGNTVVSNGTLNIAGSSALGSGTLVLAGGTTSAGSVSLANPLSVVANSAINNTSGEIIFASSSISGVSSATLTLSGVQMRFSSGGFSFNPAIAMQGTFLLRSYNAAGTQTFNGIISGSGSYQRRWPDSNLSNDGTTIFNAANTYTGETLLREGSIGFGISSVSTTPPTVDSGPIGTGNLHQDNATYTAVFASGAARTVGNPIMLTSAGQAFIIKGGFDLTLSGTVDLGGASKTIQTDNTAKSILTGDISNGDLVKTGAGVLYINGNNSASSTTVSAGTLGGTGTFSGPVTVNSGASLAPGASIGTLTINSDLSIGGNVAIEVNKSLSPSNDFVVVTGVLTNTGTGTLTVSNLGPALVVGDKFTLFSQSVSNGAALIVTGGGMNWNNNLAVDGSITAASVAVSQPPVITSTTITGGNIIISGTNGTAGAPFSVLSSPDLTTPRASWVLEASGNFGAGGGFSVSIPVSSATPAKFYLLKL